MPRNQPGRLGTVADPFRAVVEAECALIRKLERLRAEIEARLKRTPRARAYLARLLEILDE